MFKELDNLEMQLNGGCLMCDVEHGLKIIAGVANVATGNPAGVFGIIEGGYYFWEKAQDEEE